MSQFVRLAEAAKLDAERCMDAPLACRDGIAEIGDETVGGDQQRDPRGRAGRHGKGLDHHEAGARVSADHGPGAQVHDIGDELAARFDLELARRQVADQQPVMCRVTGADTKRAVQGHPGRSELAHGCAASPACPVGQDALRVAERADGQLNLGAELAAQFFRRCGGPCCQPDAERRLAAVVRCRVGPSGQRPGILIGQPR